MRLDTFSPKIVSQYVGRQIPVLWSLVFFYVAEILRASGPHEPKVSTEKENIFHYRLTVSFTVSIFPQRLWSDKLRNGREPNNGGHLILNQASIYIDFRIFARWMKLKSLRNIYNIFAILSFGFCRARQHFTWHLSLYCKQ